MDLAEIDEKLRPLLQAMSERVGYFGEFLQFTAHTPTVLHNFFEFTSAMKGLLPDRLNEAIALTVCTELKCTYERIQHERLCERLQLPRGWIAALTGHQLAEPALLEADDLAVRDLALAVIRHSGADVNVELNRVVAQLGSQGAVACLWQTTRFQMIATLVRSLEMSLPVASIFEQ